MSNLSKRLIELREKRKLSISEVARQLDVSVSTYREWEYGRAIQGEPYSRLAAILEVSLSELLLGQEGNVENELRKIEESVKNIRLLL